MVNNPTPIRPLVIDDAAKAKVAKVLEHASRNYFRPGKSARPPGDDPRFVVKLDNYRVVFSFDFSDGLLWRHMSISVPGPHYAHPAAVFTIAELFGFTGWDGRTLDRFPDGWAGQLNEKDHCVEVAQPLQQPPSETKH